MAIRLPATRFLRAAATAVALVCFLFAVRRWTTERAGGAAEAPAAGAGEDPAGAAAAATLVQANQRLDRLEELSNELRRQLEELEASDAFADADVAAADAPAAPSAATLLDAACRQRVEAVQARLRARYPDWALPTDGGRRRGPIRLRLLVPTMSRLSRLNGTLHHLVCTAGFDPAMVTVSSDADSPQEQHATATLARAYGADLVTTPSPKPDTPQQRLDAHYRFMFDHAFKTLRAEAVAIVEDDLQPAPDLAEFFYGAATVMARDQTVVCASAWHDNGYPATVADTHRLRRGSHFMALGWMILRDHYLRVPAMQTVRTDWDYRFARYMNEDPDRACIYPEVSRVHHTRTPQERAYSTTDTLQTDRYAPMAFAGHVDTDAAAPALPVDQEAAWALRPDDFEHLPLEAYEGDIRRRLRASTQIAFFEDLWLYNNANLTFVCTTCVGSDRERKGGWDTLLDSKLSVYGHGIVDPHIRGAYKGYVEYQLGGNRIAIVAADSPYTALVPPLPVQVPGPRRAGAPGTPVITSTVATCHEVCQHRSNAHPGAECSAQLLARVNTCDELQRYNVGCRSCAVDASGTASSAYIGPNWACHVVPHRHLSCHRPLPPAAAAKWVGVICACTA